MPAGPLANLTPAVLKRRRRLRDFRILLAVATVLSLASFICLMLAYSEGYTIREDELFDPYSRQRYSNQKIMEIYLDRVITFRFVALRWASAVLLAIGVGCSGFAFAWSFWLFNSGGLALSSLERTPAAPAAAAHPPEDTIVYVDSPMR